MAQSIDRAARRHWSRPAIALLLTIAALAGETGASAAPGEPEWFAIVDDWRIRRDDALGGCFAMTIYNDDSVLRVGLNPRSDSGYIMLGHETWNKLAVGQQYPIVLTFAKFEPVTGLAGVIAMGPDARLLVMSLPAERLAALVTGSKTVKVASGGLDIMTLKLDGANAAWDAMLRCQGQSDPFAAK
jgi:hypothetical protein